jgi:putative redox protein
MVQDERTARAEAEEAVIVAEADPEGFLQDIRIGADIRLVADEPAAAGGSGKGPSPYQLLASALGTCTSMTLRMYARRKGWPLEHVEVEVRHTKLHARDCADCPDTIAMADVFRRVIRIDGPLDADQRARLVEIADRCPVHRTLEGTIRVRTELAEA